MSRCDVHHSDRRRRRRDRRRASAPARPACRGRRGASPRRARRRSPRLRLHRTTRTAGATDRPAPRFGPVRGSEPDDLAIARSPRARDPDAPRLSTPEQRLIQPGRAGCRRTRGAGRPRRTTPCRRSRPRPTHGARRSTIECINAHRLRALRVRALGCADSLRRLPGRFVAPSGAVVSAPRAWRRALAAGWLPPLARGLLDPLRRALELPRALGRDRAPDLGVEQQRRHVVVGRR